MHCILPAFLAELFQLQFFFDLFLVSSCKMIDGFADFTSHFHQIFSRHTNLKTRSVERGAFRVMRFTLYEFRAVEQS